MGSSWGLGSRSGEGSRSGVKVRVMIGGHKVGGQGRWSRSGNRSWGQVGGGVKVGGPGRWSRSGEGSMFGVKVGVKVVVKVGGVKVRGQGRGVKVRVMIGGHKVLGQGRGSRSGEWSRSWGGGMPGRFGSDGRWGGRLEIKQSVPFKNSS